jgi:hypothetical protein
MSNQSNNPNQGVQNSELTEDQKKLVYRQNQAINHLIAINAKAIGYGILSNEEIQVSMEAITILRPVQQPQNVQQPKQQQSENNQVDKQANQQAPDQGANPAPTPNS